MRRAFAGALLAVVATLVVGASATSAWAFPSKTSPCGGCHGGASIAVSVSLVTIDGTTATYNVSAPGANDIAVFSGATKVALVAGASGRFSVPVGKTYTVFAVKGPGTNDGLGSTVVSPAAPVADTLPPTTTSNASASYAGSAAIRLTAVDNAGGSGVAATYYRVDGGAQVAGTMVAVSGEGTHTLEFWSVDKAGNSESHKTIGFTVTPVTPTSCQLSTSSMVIAYGAKAFINGTISAGPGLGFAPMVLQASTDNMAWKNTTLSSMSNPDGGFTFSVSPRIKTFYRVRFGGQGMLAASTSGSIAITPRVYLTKPSAPSSIVRGRSFTSWGYLKPRHAAGTYPVTLKCYRYQAGKWVLRKNFSAKASNYSTYSKYSRSISLPYAGRWRIRAYHPTTAKYAATSSTYRYVTVK